MADTIIIRTERAAEILAATKGSFNGRSVRKAEGGVSFYGSKRDQREFAEFVAGFTHPAGEPAATDRQIAYLGNLIAGDPGYASTVGCPADLNTLTKDRASQLIDRMLENR